MKITKVGFSGILKDNDMNYLSKVFSLVKNIDDNSEVTVYKTLKSYSFSIIPGEESSHKKIINALSKLHKELYITIEFSRSLKLSTIISFCLV